MLQFPHALAEAYVRPARNIAMPSLPGRQVRFLQGHATIKDGRDLAAMLRRADVLIVVDAYALSWIEQIERAAGTIKAEVRWPEERFRPRSPASDHNWPKDPLTGRFLKRALVAETQAPAPVEEAPESLPSD